MRKELEKRLIDLSVKSWELIRTMHSDPISDHLSGQLLRSSTGAALNYGEAQGAESKKDFIHKLGIVIKELRETRINLQIIQRTNDMKDGKSVHSRISETDQLISIFYSTIKSTRRNMNNQGN